MNTSASDIRIDGYVPTDPGIPVASLQRTAVELGLPASVDLRPDCSPVENQGRVGSCTANAVVGSLEYWQISEGSSYTDLSRLFVYYNARRFSDREQVDTGTSMDHVMAALLGYGACAEPIWPYDHDRWNMKPPEHVYASAVRFPELHYARVSPGMERQYVLAAGFPIIFGMGVPEILMMKIGAETGYMPRPETGFEAPKGAHAMLIVGYDDARRVWIVRNSWGSAWGDQGYVYIDYDVLDHYAFKDGYWTVGPLDRNRFFTLAGPSTQSMVASAIQAAPLEVQSSIEQFRTDIRQDLENSLEETRRGLRDRLRGQ